MSAAQDPTANPGRTPPRPAGTTRFITRNLLVASYDQRYDTLLPANSRELSERLLLAAGDRWFVRMAQNRVFRAIFRPAVRLLLPRIVPHYLARKRCLEEWLLRACDQDGCRQVVILGAGLDTLAWRLHASRPGLSFIELDRPPALDIKAAAMTAAGTQRHNLSFLPADLGDETLAEALHRSPGFDAALPTFFLAEGLLMYLTPERVRALFFEIAALGTAGVSHRFAFTFMEAHPDGWIGFRHSNPIVTWWLRRQGEPFRWSQAPDTLAAFLEPLGFTLRELVSGDGLRARCLIPAGLRDLPLAVGECLAFAQTGTIP